MTKLGIRLFIMIVAVLVSWNASAQLAVTGGDGEPSEITLPDPLTPETVRALVAELSDEDVRNLLLQRLDAVAAKETEQSEGASLLIAIQGIARDTAQGLKQSIVKSPGIPGGVAQGFQRFFEQRGWEVVGWLIIVIVLAIAIGLASEWVINRIASQWRRRIQTEEPEGLAGTLGLLIRRFILDAIGLVAFLVVTDTVLHVLLPLEPPVTKDGSLSFADATIASEFVFWVIVLPRIMRTVTRFLMAPNLPALRLVHTDDWTAKFLHRQTTIVFTIWGAMSFLLPFLASHGAPMGELRLGFFMNLAAYGIFLYGSYRVRPGLEMMMIGKDGDVTETERWVARAYPHAVIALVVITWIVVEALASQKLWGLISSATFTMIILAFAPAFDTMVRGLVRHLVPPMQGEGLIAERAYLSTKRSYIRIGRVLISVMVMVVITRLWGLDWSNLAAA